MFQNNLAFGGARRLCFVLFLYTPRVLFDQTALLSCTSRTCTFLHIIRHSPHSSNLVNLAPIFREAINASILLVAQPDEFTMPGAWEEISLVRRLETTVTTLVSRRATSSAAVKRLQDHRFAHFSCHGILETGKPFDASFSFKLYRFINYQGERLTLLDIIRSRLPSAEFAFLSACHTAELTEG